MITHRILAINPGSTSTKIAVFRNSKSRFLKTIRHSPEKIRKFKRITDQFPFRKQIILDELQREEMNLEELTAVIGRGGIVRPLLSGVYEVNEKLKEDLLTARFGEHASNLGGLIADDIARSLPHARAFIANPTTVDEFEDVARISGHPLLKRRSVFHALNHKMIARNHAKLMGKNYEEMNLIVAHMGGGIYVGAHKKGMVVEANQALAGEGPFGTARTEARRVG